MVRLAEGDAQALAQLYARHGAAVMGFLVRAALGARPDAQDLCQEVFLTVWHKARTYREEGKTRSWLLGIAAHKARAHLRKQRVRKTLLSLFSVADSAVAEPAFATLLASDQRRQVEVALRALSDEQRLVILMHVVEGMGAPDIAAALGIRTKTVWTRLHRARVAMRQALGTPLQHRSARQP